MAQEAISLIKEAESLAARDITAAEQKAKTMIAEAKAKASEILEECNRSANEEAQRISENAKAEYDNYIASYLKASEYDITDLQSKADERIDEAIREVAELLF